MIILMLFFGYALIEVCKGHDRLMENDRELILGMLRLNQQLIEANL